MTKQRQLVLRLVQTSCAHRTADEIFQEARREMPSIGLATVYRNLTQLSLDNAIRRIPVEGEPDRFDKTVINHEHAVCRLCGGMRDVNVGDIQKSIREGLGHTDFTYELSIHDLCPVCRAKEDAKTKHRAI